MFLRPAWHFIAPAMGVLLLTFSSAYAGSLPARVGDEPVPSLAPMVSQVVPGVVNISTRSHIRVEENPLFNDPFFRRFFDVPSAPREREEQSLGSGVIVDADKGYVITNHHVIDKADEITVTLRDGRHFKAKVVGDDPEGDIALLHIDAKNLTAVPLADSDKLRVGDFVVAVGNPFGLGQTVTSGIVSALGRSGLGIEGYEDFIQTDASINPGNSGGALVNLKGELVGINTAIIGPSGGNVGIGFAIPINMAKDIMAQLVQYGEVRRGRLGVYIQDVTPELAKAFDIENIKKGAVVAQVVKGSAADKAGLKVGDVIVAVNDKPVEDSTDLRNKIGLMRVGQSLTLDIIRDGSRQTIKATIAEPEEDKMAASKISDQLSGAVLGTIQEDHPLYGRVEGVQVLSVDEDSDAWNAGLRKDDIIVSVNRVPVKTLEDVKKAAKKSRDGLLLNVRRGQGALFLLLK
jgi:Do/DeqQ family serine protease